MTVSYSFQSKNGIREREIFAVGKITDWIAARLYKLPFRRLALATTGMVIGASRLEMSLFRQMKQ